MTDTSTSGTINLLQKKRKVVIKNLHLTVFLTKTLEHSHTKKRSWEGTGQVLPAATTDIDLWGKKTNYA